MNKDDHTLIINRSKDYWFEDGNIILQVQQTQFCLSKSILALHSPVFRQMFSVPSRLPLDEPLSKECPIVVLRDESQDWEHLLGVIFPKDSSFARPPSRPTRSSIWRENSGYSILPSAFYHLIDYPEGIHDHNLVKLDNIQDRAACLRAYIEILRSFNNAPLKLEWLSANSGISWVGCTSKLRCSSERKELLMALLPNTDFVVAVLGGWNRTWDEKMCESCVGEAKEVFEAARNIFWEKLPSYFGLDDWEALQMMNLE
ncbi:BTB domain-containing protein [Mycena indigotica]|uniref:BTB domain-containing protein n=1 Tax=Mycena indigotica TaxID=2126181 RepID=A0A8H6W4W3_9AGAR|nr:BTB domain-containing protein [Mycena indigotica]KAF7299334.1 BTB domain-containing protein [Mycena indigotica]